MHVLSVNFNFKESCLWSLKPTKVIFDVNTYYTKAFETEIKYSFKTSSILPPSPVYCHNLKGEHCFWQAINQSAHQLLSGY
uniref:Uncharacterized protein n=1 Tax=Anguilla anguilla TaxID=7936 RepID=A0A0E9Q952_ANGAN